MKNEILIFIFFICLCLFCCSPERFNGYKIGTDSYHGDNCIVLDKADTIPPENYPYHKDYGAYISYHYNNDSVDVCFIIRDICVIGGLVLNTTSDSIFILVEQKPRRFIMEKYGLYFLNASESKEQFDKSKIRHYYIINQISNDIYGPLDTISYLKKRKELGVSETIKLDFEKHMKYKK